MNRLKCGLTDCLRLLLLCAAVMAWCLLLPISLQAQSVSTEFPQSQWVFSGDGKYKARLYQVQLDPRGYTYVTVEMMPVAKLRRMNYWYSNQTYALSGRTRLPLLGALSGDGASITGCSYDHGRRWSNPAIGSRYHYTLVFSGVFPPGSTDFSLIDNATYGRGFSFRGYRINNPKTQADRDEVYCIGNIDDNNDGIVGIYESMNGYKYRLACIKENGYYGLIYLGSETPLAGWQAGNIKASLTETATRGLFKANWCMLNHSNNNNVIVVFDGTGMDVSIRLADGSVENDSYIKMYPMQGKTEVAATSWSGTGWALGDGYVVTNNHVAEGAKAITIKGIGGNHNTGYAAEVVTTDKVNDLAILKIVDGRFAGFGMLPYGISPRIADVGEDVFVLGFPLGQQLGDEIKLTTGIINSRTGAGEYHNCYQIQAPITYGNSGGPVFDSKGNVIGIVVGGLNKELNLAENVGYAIKASYLKILIESAGLDITFPKSNTISALSLPEKVKRVKGFVYYIECSR